MKKIIVSILMLVPLITLASFPSEDFESYSVGDLSGKNGGSGWSAAWGTTGGCHSSFDVVTTPVLAGINAGGSGQVLGECYRDFTFQNTDNAEISFILRAEENNLTHVIYPLQQKAVSSLIIFYLRSTGQIAVYDNLTITNIQAYSANTNYIIKIKVNYTNETFNVSIDGSAYGPTYHMYDYLVNAFTGSDRIDLSVDSGNEGYYIDNIGDVSASPPAGASATSSLSTFQMSQIFLMGLILFFLFGIFIIWAQRHYFN